MTMARMHAPADINISDLTQSTLIFGGLCICALHFGSMIETSGHAAMVEEVKVAQFEDSVGSDAPDLLASCSGKEDTATITGIASDSRCKTNH
ncbi:MAG: hypothetical protein V4692_12170 [Bdellovibrionota bacterium]